MIEALSRKGAALCQLYYYNSLNNIIDTTDITLQSIDDIWIQTTRFISPDSDAKVCVLIILMFKF